ncbi:MAG: penicillin-binding protein 2 [Candidatus Sedimenticola endophacoides]
MSTKRRQQRVAKTMKQERVVLPSYRRRRWTLLTLLGVALVALVWRAVDQQIFETDFLQNEGERRHLRVVDISAHRGMVTDRRGEPVAISTPVESVWANPQVFSPDPKALSALAGILEKDGDEMRRQLAARSDRSFVYLRRRVNPDVARQVMELVEREDLRGIGLQREFRRYYPDGEVLAHVVGFTDVDDQGQEGLERAFNDHLEGVPGKKRVLQDGLARPVKDVESISKPIPGRQLHLSIDRRLQFLAYRELKAAVGAHRARSGSVVILDAKSGEILVMVNQPAYNPNGARDGAGGSLRNRAMTDVFEPGSTMKPFTIAAGLELGDFSPETRIDTAPGFYKVGRHQIRDHRNYGTIDLSTVLRKSSNVGASKVALALPKRELWGLFSSLGFGELSAVGFPGEANGQLLPYTQWAEIDHATIAFGYSLSVTPLQLAQAYAVLANDGVKLPVTLLHREEAPAGHRVLSVATARSIRGMLESVVSVEGTAPAAAVPGYRVAGKTGTVKKSVRGGYADDRYLSVFAGMAPLNDPRLVMVVVVDEPSTGEFYGGKVAAPVFSRVMTGALRLLNVAPDAVAETPLRVAGVEARQ